MVGRHTLRTAVLTYPLLVPITNGFCDGMLQSIDGAMNLVTREALEYSLVTLNLPPSYHLAHS